MKTLNKILETVLGLLVAVMAVSYTHLDVYKRQEPWQLRTLQAAETVLLFLPESAAY